MAKAIATTGGNPASIGASDWGAMREMATTLVKSGFLPKSINTPEKAIAIIITGQEIGLGPMQALRSIHIIEGKPTMGAELMMALALKRVPGGYIKIVECTNDQCVVRAGRSRGDTADYRFTIEDAKRAGLLGKSNWKNYPRAMLRSRVISEAVKAVFPDAMIGAYTAEELGHEVTAEDGGPEIESIPGAVMTQASFAPIPERSPAELAEHRKAWDAKRKLATDAVMAPSEPEDSRDFKWYECAIREAMDEDEVLQWLKDAATETPRLKSRDLESLQITASDAIDALGEL